MLIKCGKDFWFVADLRYWVWLRLEQTKGALVGRVVDSHCLGSIFRAPLPLGSNSFGFVFGPPPSFFWARSSLPVTTSIRSS